MGLLTCNVKITRKCAFCQNWFDPTCSAIEPVHGDIWKYNPDQKCKCRITGTDKRGFASCSRFVSKI